jgi:hypothetical protein
MNWLRLEIAVIMGKAIKLLIAIQWWFLGMTINRYNDDD